MRIARRAQAEDSARGLPGRGRRDVGARVCWSSPLSFEIVTIERRFASTGLTASDFADALRGRVERSGEVICSRPGFRRMTSTVLRRLDMRYIGQGYEIEVTGCRRRRRCAFDALPQLFAEAYEADLRLSFLDQPIEIVNWKVEARGTCPNRCGCATFRTERRFGAGAQGRCGARSFPRPAATVDCPVYRPLRAQAGRTDRGAGLDRGERVHLSWSASATGSTVDGYLNLVRTRSLRAESAA